MLVKSSVTCGRQDIELYSKLVANGELYEYMGGVLKDELGMTFPDRKSIKEMVFTVLFTSNHFIGQDEAKPKKLFKKLFPTVYKVISYLKKKDKTFLACLLQRVEKYLILEVICKRISEEHPNIPLYTIHDSIATTSGNEKYVEAIMREELTKHIGISPKLKFDYWFQEAFI